MEVLGEDDGSLVVEHTHVLPRLLVNVPDFTYVCFKRTQRQVVNSKFACSLQFTAKEIDPVSNEPEDVGYEDAYVLEDVAVLPADLVTATKLSNPIEMLPS
jgi:coatomer protein complex subunit gamma